MKVIFFDLDGTILSHQTNSIPESTLLALDKLKTKGILRVLCTGRHRKELEELHVSHLDFDAWILLNGQLILDRDFSILWENPIEGNKKEILLSLFKNKKYPIQLLEKDDFYINYVNDDVRYAQASIHTSIPDISEYRGNVIYQGILFVDQQKEEQVKEEFDEDVLITRWNDYAIDVVSSQGGKGNAIQAFLKHFDIEKEESMAFGDGLNDCSMFEQVGTGIAMGNSHPDLKKQAQFVTKDIDDDGIMFGLLRYGL